MSVCRSCWRRRAPVLAFVPAVIWVALTVRGLADSDPGKITGPNECAECHKHEATVWKATHHFSTFRNMPRSKEAREIARKMGIKRIKSKSLCLSCHFTTKIVKSRPKPIAGISCERCHGDGGDYLKIHAEFSGKKKKQDETKAQALARWRKSVAAGMIRPGALYKLAKNCYGCHVVPRERLVNIGGHPAGSAFELVSWSQGEVRHNLWYSNGRTNAKASAGRKRLMYVVGLAVELETALRAVAVATKKKAYAIKMARRAAAARKRIAIVSKTLPRVPQLGKIVVLGSSAGLKLNNNAALTKAADGIAVETLSIVNSYDGGTFAGIDALIPAPGKYKGKPAK